MHKVYPDQSTNSFKIFQVGSSTWCMQFLTLANATDAEKKHWSQALQVQNNIYLIFQNSRYKLMFFPYMQIAAPTYWPLPSYDNLNTLLEPMLSFVFVRNPFDRLVSVYNEKILKNPLGPWKSVIQGIIKDYRPKQEKKSTNFETMVPRYDYF